MNFAEQLEPSEVLALDAAEARALRLASPALVAAAAAAHRLARAGNRPPRVRAPHAGGEGRAPAEPAINGISTIKVDIP